MQWPRRKNSAYLGLEKTASMAEAQWMNGNGKKQVQMQVQGHIIYDLIS